MKFNHILTAAALAVGTATAYAAPVQDVRPVRTEPMSATEISDRIALKELVDTFSNLADEKRIDEQVLLFTENASVQSLENGKANPPETFAKKPSSRQPKSQHRFSAVSAPITPDSTQTPP